MRYLNALTIVVVTVFIIGTNSAEVFAKRPSNPPELEQRVTDLEGQVADHEIRIQNEESNNTGQNQRLDSLEQEQVEQNNRLDVLESQPPTVGGIQVFDSSNPAQFVGLLVSILPQEISTNAQDLLVEAHLTIFVPSLGKLIELNRTGEIVTTRFRLPHIDYELPGCDESGSFGAAAPPQCSTCRVIDPAYISAHLDMYGTMRYYTAEVKEGEVIAASRHEWGSSVCLDPYPNSAPGFMLTEVTLPFTIPLTMPLSFQ